MEQEDAPVLGGRGFEAVVKRKGWVTRITGTVRDGRVYRVQTTMAADKAGKLRAIHSRFLSGFRITR